ncbi:BnaC02g20330D [Brassica napus]|uniref:BnaC02g20330D protein n=1 Tax=Brassica napus TaxID=3708 RepID=A0A078F808_BRANA|nr:BnaC02g20330D [Brassica napus]
MQSMLSGGCLFMTRLFRDLFSESGGMARFLDISDFRQLHWKSTLRLFR